LKHGNPGFVAPADSNISLKDVRLQVLLIMVEDKSETLEQTPRDEYSLQEQLPVWHEGLITEMLKYSGERPSIIAADISALLSLAKPVKSRIVSHLTYC